MIDRHSPIGIFDSGVGGLTVVRAVQKVLPNENIIYFGDTARVPYGIKSEKTVRSYGLEITDFLMEKEVKMILIACNTVSASARYAIEEATDSIPVLNVISAGAEAAMQFPSHKHIGVIGTLATIGSEAYDKAIQEKNGDVTVTSKACPLLVPLAEEGWTTDKIAKQVLQRYLQGFENTTIDSLILGCTHYPLFKPLIEETIHHPKIQIIDSGAAIAEAARQKLAANELLSEKKCGSFSCYVSDRPQRFQKLAERFLGKLLDDVYIERLG